MRSLSAHELLEFWEQSLARAPAHRAFELLAGACPDSSLESLAALSIGERDARLMALRETVFGEGITGLATCPACPERLEFSLDSAAIRAQQKAEPEREIDLSVAGYNLRFRLPNVQDAMAVAAVGDSQTGAGMILRHCLLTAQHEGELVDPACLPSEVIDLVAQRMADADPLADIQVALVCPACKHEWHTNFDVVSFFWAEIEAWASRILNDVHILASAYGWPEQEILNLSPVRRQYYLQMIGA